MTVISPDPRAVAALADEAFARQRTPLNAALVLQHGLTSLSTLSAQ